MTVEDRSRRPPAPRLPDLLGPLVLGAVGLGLLVVAWVGAHAHHTVAPQLTFVNLGASGVVLVGAACAVHLLNLRRAVRRRRVDVGRHRRLAR